MPAIKLSKELTYQLTYLPTEDVLPPEILVDYWGDTYTDEGHTPEWILRHVADRAAEWGADIELEKCAVYLDSPLAMKTPESLVAARRLTPTLKKQALKALRDVATGANEPSEQRQDLATIRQALEALPDGWMMF